MSFRRLLPALVLVLLSACGDQGPVSGPGTLVATLESPNGAEGAALISLLGDSVGAVSGFGDTEVFSEAGNSVTRVVLVNQNGGDLSFRVAVADTTALLNWVIHEVAGTDDQLRPSVAGYAIGVGR